MARSWLKIAFNEFEFASAAQEMSANIGAERLDDILTNLMEGMAGMGVKQSALPLVWQLRAGLFERFEQSHCCLSD